MKHTSITLKERIELILREEVNKCSDIEMFVEECTLRMTELIQDEKKYGRQD